MSVKLTQSQWDFSITQWHLKCKRTLSSLMYNTTRNSSLINNTITTPLWNLETKTSDNLSTINEIVVMVSAMFGMIMVIILYATTYKLLDCKRDSYHDTCYEGGVHVALTLFSYLLYLFDTLSDVLLFLQYVAIGQASNFLLVAALTLAPVLFLEFIFVAKWHNTWTCGYNHDNKPSRIQIFFFKILGLLLVLIFTPLAALLPTFIYAQVLAIGKDENKSDQNSHDKCEKGIDQIENVKQDYEKNRNEEITNGQKIADNENEEFDGKEENGKEHKRKDNEQSQNENIKTKDDNNEDTDGKDNCVNVNCLKGNKDNENEKNENGKGNKGKANEDNETDVDGNRKGQNGNENDHKITDNTVNGKEEDTKGKEDDRKEKGKHEKVQDKDDKDKKRFTFEYVASYLTLVEATLESAPQLTVQLYLSITDTYTDITSTRVIRYLSIVGSSLALAWSLTAFCHQNRKKEKDQDDSFFIKFIHWISRIAEIVPRIILIALVTAEYSGYVMYFIVYRFIFAIIYAVCEIWAEEDLFGLSELPDILLGIIGNIFCFSVSDVYKLQKKKHCGGKFFAGYYILFYVENGGLLYLWYSDDPVLLQIKIGGACSNHEWFLPYVFVVVILGFLFQPSFLYLYYRLRKEKCDCLTRQSPISSAESKNADQKENNIEKEPSSFSNLGSSFNNPISTLSTKM